MTQYMTIELSDGQHVKCKAADARRLYPDARFISACCDGGCDDADACLCAALNQAAEDRDAGTTQAGDSLQLPAPSGGERASGGDDDSGADDK